MTSAPLSSLITRSPRRYHSGRAEDAEALLGGLPNEVRDLCVNAASTSPYLLGLMQKEADWLQAAADDPAVAIQAEVLSYVKGNPDAAASLTQAYRTFRMATAGLVALGQAEGLIATDRPGLPDMVHALIDGLTLKIAADPDADVDGLRGQLKDHLHAWFRSEA